MDASSFSSPDFISACTTCSVPRKHLLLLVLRINNQDDTGTNPFDKYISTVSILIDGRISINNMRDVIVNTLNHLRIDGIPRDSHAFSLAHISCTFRGQDQYVLQSPIFFHDKLPGASETQFNTSIESQLRRDTDGIFKYCIRGTKPIYGYKKNVNVLTPLCMKSIVKSINDYDANVDLVNKPHIAIVIRALRELSGNGKPTTLLHNAVLCKSTDRCDCFIERAVFRAGLGWMHLDVIIPPVDHIMNLSRPTQKTLEDHFTLSFEKLSSIIRSLTSLSEHVDMTDEEESISSSVDASNISLQLISVCQYRNKQHIYYILQEYETKVSPFYTPCIRYLQTKFNSDTFIAKLIKGSRFISTRLSDQDIYGIVRKSIDYDNAIVRVMEKVVNVPFTTRMKFIESTYMLGAIIMFIHACIETHQKADRPHFTRRLVNKWDDYETDK